MKLKTLLITLAFGLGLLWLLEPSRSNKISEPGVVEIAYMAPGGPIASPMEDAVREFEAISRRKHEADPSQPVYRVVSGQNASRDQVSDPTRFLVSVAGGVPPDVIYFDRFAVSEWASRGAFERLDPFLARDIREKNPDALKADAYYKPCWDEAIYTNPKTGEKGLYGIPNGLDTRVLFYNKDLLKRAGFNGPPKTWEELEKMAVALTERAEDKHIERLGFIPNHGDAWLYLYGWMMNGEFMSPDGKLCTINEPRIVKALDWMTAMYDRLGGAKEVYAFQQSFQTGNLDPFITGKVAMKIDGYWMLNAMATHARYLNWATAPAPMPAAELAKGRKPISWTGGWCYAIPSTAKHKDEAWEFIRFMSSRKAVEMMAKSEAVTAASQGHSFVPAQHPNMAFNDMLASHYVYNDSGTDIKIKDAVRNFNAMIPSSRFRPVTAVGQLLWNQHITATENAIFHKLTPQEALDEAAKNINRKLDATLHETKGGVIAWNFWFVIYLGLALLTAIGAYQWDTRPNLRSNIAGLLGPWGKSLLKAGGSLDGVTRAYMRRDWKAGWICASPWLFGMLVFTGGPIFFSIIISFSDYDILNSAHWSGIDNYKWMFTKDPLFWKSLYNTIFMMIGIPLGMGLSLSIALLLNLKVRGIALWRTFFYLPSIIPAVASSILWIWILNPSGGLANAMLESVGLHGLNWLQDENTSKTSLILMGLWGSGGGMIIWLAGLKGISQSYYEAASIDGADSMQKFWYITLPMLTPYIFFNLIMGIIGSFQIFSQAFIITQGGPVNSTLFYVYHLFNNAFRYLQMGYASAMAWFLFLIVLMLTLVQMRVSKRWVHYEGE